MASTTNYSWSTPDDTALVKDGAAAIRSLGSAIDSTVFTNAGAAIAKTIVDAKGDIIAATAADTVDRLAVGTNNQVLTADSSTATGLKWATAASGGMTVLASGTLSGASLALTSISGSYRQLKLVIQNPSSVSGGGGGPQFTVNGITSYNTAYIQANQTSVTQATGSSDVTMPFTIPSSLNNYQLFIFTVDEYASVTSHKYGQFIGSSGGAGAPPISGYWGSIQAPTTAINAITVTTGGAGNWDAGTYVLYGVS
jgi:hypothetical protein